MTKAHLDRKFQIHADQRTYNNPVTLTLNHLNPNQYVCQGVLLCLVSNRAVFVKFQKGGSTDCEARRADARGPKGRRLRPEGPRAGRGSWRGGSKPPPHQLGGLGERCKLGSGAEPRKILNLVNLGT